MLSPVGNFGKFLTVMLSLSVTANIACTLYSMCFNFQALVPALAKVPRYVFPVVGTAMYVPWPLSQRRSCSFLFNLFFVVRYHSPSSGPTSSIPRSQTSLVSSATGQVHMVPSSLLNTFISGRATSPPMITRIGMLPSVCHGEQLL